MTTFHRFSNFIPCADIFIFLCPFFPDVHGADIQANKILWTFTFFLAFLLSVFLFSVFLG
jgi:hypothetical protein